MNNGPQAGDAIIESVAMPRREEIQQLDYYRPGALPRSYGAYNRFYLIQTSKAMT